MFHGKSQPPPPAPPEPPKTPCEACEKPAKLFDAFGAMLCVRCCAVWQASPEHEASRLQLEPMPLWQMQRLKQAGHTPPPMPSFEMIEAEYRRCVQRWLAARRPVQGVAW